MIKKNNIPILEYDDMERGIIHASDHISPIDIPEHAAILFFKEVIDDLIREHPSREAFSLRSEAGPHPVYEIEFEGRKIVLIHPVLGGPFAAGFIEELMALGCRKFIACGGAGVLDRKIQVGHVIIPIRALRAEGTSYHYLPASRYVDLDEVAVKAVSDTLEEAGVPFLKAATWTTDAFYRETPEMVRYRREEGCLTVEMECASFAAAARFRGAVFGQILYGGDDVSGEAWDSREWNRNEIRKKLGELAIRACLKL